MVKETNDLPLKNLLLESAVQFWVCMHEDREKVMPTMILKFLEQESSVLFSTQIQEYLENLYQPILPNIPGFCVAASLHHST